MQTVCRVHYHKLTWPSSPSLFSKLSPLSSSLHRTQCACLYPSQLIHHVVDISIKMHRITQPDHHCACYLHHLCYPNRERES